MRNGPILLAFLSIFFLSVGQNAAGQSQCAKTFLTPEFQARAAIQDLARLRLDLDLAEAQGLSSPKTIALERKYAQRENELIEYFGAQKIMTRDQMLALMRHEIEDAQSATAEVSEQESVEKERQKQALNNAEIDGSRIDFYEIESGIFNMGEVGSQKPVVITKPFEMAATLTTQIVWRMMVEEAQKKFPFKFGMLKTNPSTGNRGHFNPVETVSYHDIQNWLKAVNTLAASGDPIIDELMPGHKKGDSYRLPTEAEWEFVARARGAAPGKFHFGDNDSDLERFAWSGGQGIGTRPVATKEPLEFEGKKFYDIHGNVFEVTEDAYIPSMPGGTDPFILGNYHSQRVIRGGDWSAARPENLRTARRSVLGPKGNFLTGFRLTRIHHEN